MKRNIYVHCLKLRPVSQDNSNNNTLYILLYEDTWYVAQSIKKTNAPHHTKLVLTECMHEKLNCGFPITKHTILH